MEKLNNGNIKCLPMLMVSSLLFFSAFLCNSALHANTQPPGIQLAYFIGYHTYNDYTFSRPITIQPRTNRPRGTYWTGWRYVGHGCQKNCLIDRWRGRAIRCSKRC